MKKKISIILPCYNEGEKIYENMEFLYMFLKKFLTKLKINFELILVNDGSKDNTGEEIERFKIKYKLIKIVNYEENMGKGYALESGLELASGDLIAFYDADLDIYPVSLFKAIKFLLENKDYHMVAGSKKHRKSKVNYTFKRKIISITNSILNKILFSLPVKDTQTGLKVFRKEIKDVFLENVKTLGYAFDVEFLYHVHDLNYKIKELPVKIHLSQNSGVNSSTILYYLQELCILYRKIAFTVVCNKITLLTRIKLFFVKCIVFPLENIVRFFLIMKNKKEIIIRLRK